MSQDGDELEPLGAVEQAMLDDWLKIKGPEGCNWVVDAGGYCNKPLAQLTSRLSYCEEHLRRSLTEAGWRRVLANAGRVPE